jgi:Uncharacterised protein family (UPF0158)
MATPVKLKDMVNELPFIPDAASSYLNTKTGEIVSVTHEELRAAENEEPLEDFPEWQRDAICIAGDILETDHYLPLPTKFDIHEYSIMERFCLSIEADDICDDLCHAIRGRGAFRCFKDRIHEYGMADDWYQYRDEALREIAIEWCEENGIPYTE